jgi:CHAT domain-containing protein
LGNLGLTFLQTDQLNKAKLAYFQALEVLESLRGELDDSDKVSLIDTQANAYNGLQKVLVDMGETASALEVSERSRARVFVELLARQVSASSDNGEQSPPMITFPKVEQLKKIAREQNATLVEYSQVSDKLLYIWVIQPTGEIDFRQVDPTNPDSELVAQAPTPPSSSPTSDSEEVRGLVAETRATVIVTSDGNQSQTLKRNHELLIEPIADLLPDDPEERVIFIPDGSLFFVPFPALQNEEGTYLIEKHTILTAPAIQVLDLTRDLRENGNNSTSETASEHLIVGNPTMPSLKFSLDEPTQPLTSLPGAEREALSIAQLNNSQALIGEQATESAIVKQMPQARIIHLATHGLLDYGIPEASLVRDVPGAIALAPSDTDDGLLTSAEILDLNLNAELVVLSACDTGRGNITSDGVIGLSRSLIMAGVPSVVVSLWSVPDAPTAELMTEFYRQMEQTPDKAQALRQAMLKTMETHPNPRDWAAFTLIGEAE